MGGVLLLEDGRRFEGEAFGAKGTMVGEVVFNTSMTGYQEVLTDPSYREQIVVMTVPHVGNYGVNTEDPESHRVWVSGFVARRFSSVASNHRSEDGLDRYLRSAGVPGLHGIDTRALVRHIRDKGAMKAVISTDGSQDGELSCLLDSYPGMVGRKLATEVSTDEPYTFAEGSRGNVHVVDGGVKRNIMRLMAEAGCAVRVFPASATAEQWMDGADLIFLSNGPGDPAALPEMVGQIRKVLGRVPTFGVCLGHQLLGLALDGETYKLPFGHRGGNHPVRDLETGRVEITSQNHGFAVVPESVTKAGAALTHVNLNDGTLEGFRHDDLRIMAVQFHPEASPGPRDSSHLLLERYLEYAGI